jgi:hypothetical protein
MGQRYTYELAEVWAGADMMAKRYVSVYSKEIVNGHLRGGDGGDGGGGGGVAAAAAAAAAAFVVVLVVVLAVVLVAGVVVGVVRSVESQGLRGRKTIVERASRC